MNLYINTKDQKIVVVALKKEGKIAASLSEENEYGSQVLLPLIIKLMQKICTTPSETPQVSIQIHPEGGQWKMLEGIEVETGQGSFTGLRVGVSVANALGFALGIPVNGKKMETELAY